MAVLVAVTTWPGAAAWGQCVGDCNGDERVRIFEAQRCVNIRIGTQAVAACIAADQNGDGVVTDNEVDLCVQSFLDASTCPRVFTPGPTNTAPAPPTATPPPATATRTNTSGPPATPTNTLPPTNTAAPPTNTAPPATNTAPPATSTPVSATCTFAGASDDSALVLCLAGSCPFQTLDPSGSIRINCGSTDANGQRPCTCDIVTFDPVTIIGIGVACVDPAATTCPTGVADCDGGSPLNLDTVANHQAATCTSNADCASQCQTYCGGLSKAVFGSACEGFCQGGTSNDLPCHCDTATAATCTTSSPQVCPMGSCEGKDDERTDGDLDCHCQCIDAAFGTASPAGTVQCRLGTSIRVETAAPCDNSGVLVRLPPLCGALTSATATQMFVGANEAGPDLSAANQTGAPLGCDTFNTGSTVGLDLVTNLAFFDSTVGDISTRLRLDCH